MAAFADINGTNWSVNIDVDLARSLRRDYVDAIDLVKPDDLSRLLKSDELLFGLLWLVVERQATARGVADPQAFDALLAQDDVATAAIEALLGSLSDFSRRFGKKTNQTILSMRMKATTTTKNAG